MVVLQNHRHELYCRGIVEGKTSDRAYADAGYQPSRKNASRLRAKEDIQGRIRELQNRGLERHDVTVDRIIKQYAKLAFSDIRQLFDERGNLKPPCELPDAIAGAISNLEIATVQKGQGAVEHVAKIKLGDKRSALVDLGKHFGLFDKDVTIETEAGQQMASELELARRLAFMLEKGARSKYFQHTFGIRDQKVPN
jgi:phage terminase small subunit